MTEAETNEKLNQEDYEEMMADSAAKRAADSKSLAQREGAKADTERALVDAESEKTSTVKELMATVVGQLHGECDWLVKYFNVRKESFKASKKGDRQRLDFIMLAVRGKKVGFDKIIKMIDVMVALLKEEQVDDDSKKEYCEMSLDKADDMKEVLEPSVSKLEKAIDEAKETIATLTDEIKALAAGIVALDKSVAEATEQRNLALLLRLPRHTPRSLRRAVVLLP